MRITTSLDNQPAAILAGTEQTSAAQFSCAIVAPDTSPPFPSTR